MDHKQMNHLRRAASDKYRETRNLLTSKEIIQYRERLGMSQLSFANYLNVGEASIKRWETYFIQEASLNDHIRVKCDEAYAESNILFILSKSGQADIYTGEKTFSFSLFKHLESTMLQKLGACTNYLDKLHFYLDFLHFKRHKKGITGIKYVPLKFGPSPYQYKLYSKMAQPLLSGVGFNTQENQTIDDICGFYKQDEGGKKMYDLSCKEKGYTDTSENSFISYKYAHNLLI